MSSEPDATALRRVTRAGEYDLLRKMGSGGFGVVYEAKHRDTGLLFALKRIELSLEDAERFRKEALYPAQIASRSLHVLGVHSFFHDSITDAFYLVTELIPHGDLKNFLAQRPKPLPLAQALHLGIGIAKGLAAIHALGIVHRDVKPANVLMDKKDGQWVPKIADFGLARSHSSVSIGEFASSGYASPEQLDLLSDKPVGTESDLFSFGMVLYELLTGERPSSAQDLRAYGRWIKDRRPPPPPSTVRPELGRFVAVDTLVASLIEFEPTRRTTSAATCTKVLQDALLALARPAGPRAPSSHPQIPAAPIQAAPPPIPTPLPTPLPTPVQAAPPPMPTPLPLPAAGVAQPLIVPQPLVSVAKPRAKKRGIGWLIAGAALAVAGLLAAGGWWGWQLYTLRDAARRGQALFRDREFTKSIPLLRQAGTNGDAVSQAMLGKIYGLGLGRKADYDEARIWFERAAAQDNATGLAGHGWGLLRGKGYTADPERGVPYLRQAAERGDSMGHAWLGWAFESGTGVDKDEAEAVKHYRLATDEIYATGWLAHMYQDGRGGLPRSPSDALTLYRQAADKGHLDSMCQLGTILSDRYAEARRRFGQGNQAEAKEAADWYRRAADDGMTCGELGIGYMYDQGYGVPESYDKAVMYYERAAAHGSEAAKRNLTRAVDNWVLPPMFLGAWRQVNGDERREEIDRLQKNGILDRLGARDVQRLRRIELDFYESATLFELEIARTNRPRGVYTYVRHSGRVVVINGAEAPLRELNGMLHIDTMGRAISYLRFFMAAYQDQNAGQINTTYRLVDSGSDVPWLPAAPEYVRNSVGAQIVPATMRPSASGGWEASVCAQHGNAIIRMTLWLKPDGGFKLLTREAVADSLAIEPERFDDQGLRVRASS